MSNYIPVPPMGTDLPQRPPPASLPATPVPPGTNPLLHELNSLSPAAKQALQQAHHQSSTPPPSVMGGNQVSQIPHITPPDSSQQAAPIMNSSMPGAAAQMPSLPGAPAMAQYGGRGSVAGEEGETQRLIQNPSGMSQIHSKIENSGFGQNHPLLGKIAGWGAQIPAQIADVAGKLAVPGLEQQIPGTEGNRQMLINHQAQTTGLLQGQRAKDTENDLQTAQAANEQAKPELAEAKGQLAAEKQHSLEQHQMDTLNAGLSEHGLQMDPSTGKPVPLPYNKLPPEKQGQIDVQQATKELKSAQGDYEKAKVANLPQEMEMARQRIENAQKNIGLGYSKLGLQRERLDFQEDKTYNPEPTPKQRDKGDMATSSINQVHNMQDVLTRRGNELFGPGAGRANRFQQWIGSSDPDAIKFRDANTYLADHSAAMFGARSKEVLQSLHDLGSERFNPAALQQYLKDAETTSRGFQQAGTPHAKGGTSGFSVPPSGNNPNSGNQAPEGTRVQTANGVQVKRNGKWVNE